MITPDGETDYLTQLILILIEINLFWVKNIGIALLKITIDSILSAYFLRKKITVFWGFTLKKRS